MYQFCLRWRGVCVCSHPAEQAVVSPFCIVGCGVFLCNKFASDGDRRWLQGWLGLGGGGQTATSGYEKEPGNQHSSRVSGYSASQLEQTHLPPRLKRGMMPATTHRALLSALTVALVVVLVSAFTEDLCAKYGEMVVIPGIDGTDFCKTAQLMDQNMEKCLLLDMAGLAFTRDKMGITLSNTVGALACKAAQQTPIPVNRVDGKHLPVSPICCFLDGLSVVFPCGELQHCCLHLNHPQLLAPSLLAGTPISHTLPDLRPLPVAFPSSILAAEGATYHFWWSQVLNFGTASSCAATRTPHTLTEGMLQLEAPGQWNLAPGWSIHSAVWSNANMGSSLAGVYLPLAAVMHKGDVLAVVIRGTETFSDWEAGKGLIHHKTAEQTH